jgi:hypothetical protein
MPADPKGHAEAPLRRMPPSEPTRPSPGPLFCGRPERRLFVLLGAVLLLVSWLVNSRVAGYDFLALGDDDINVTLNPHLGVLDHDRWVWLFGDVSYVRRFMPLGWMTLCALFQVNGLDPFCYHSAALAFYIVNVALVYVLVLQVVRVFVPAAAAGATAWQVFAVFLAAGWWALHPLRVESTAWISGILYGQGATLVLAALIFYMRSYLAAARGRRRGLWVGLALAAATASLMTYPIALGFPFMLLAMDYLFARARPLGPVPFRRLAAEKALFLAPVAAIALFTAYARMRNPSIWGHVPTLAEFPLVDRVMQGAYIVAYYVWRPLVPFRLPPITPALLDFDPWSSAFILSATLVILISAAALLLRRRRPWVGALWLAYLSAIVPFAGFTEHPYYASDRYAYVPTVVWCAALAAGLACIPGARLRRAALVATLGLIATLALTTDRVLGIWADPRTMYAYLVESLPEGEQHDRILSRFAMFEYLYGNPAQARLKIERCVRDFPKLDEIQKVRSAIEDPSGRLAPVGERRPIAFMHEQMGLYFLRSHQPAEAGEQFRRALGFDPDLVQANYDLAVLEATGGRPRDALGHYLWAEAHAGAALSRERRVSCLGLISDSARAAGDAGLERAVGVRLGLGGAPR